MNCQIVSITMVIFYTSMVLITGIVLGFIFRSSSSKTCMDKDCINRIFEKD